MGLVGWFVVWLGRYHSDTLKSVVEMEKILTFRVCPEVVVFMLALFIHKHTYAIYTGKGCV
jgi:hypothetical protein